ncbi:hypothetical protein Trydic_g10608 [Trypoxylus dichotomus]
MKAVAYFCCVMLFILPLSRCDPVGSCPAENEELDVLLADDVDCTIFYKCNEGEAVVQICPPDLAYNPELSVCDWAENVQC